VAFCCHFRQNLGLGGRNEDLLSRAPGPSGIPGIRAIRGIHRTHPRR